MRVKEGNTQKRMTVRATVRGQPFVDLRKNPRVGMGWESLGRGWQGRRVKN